MPELTIPERCKRLLTGQRDDWVDVVCEYGGFIIVGIIGFIAGLLL